MKKERTLPPPGPPPFVVVENRTTRPDLTAPWLKGLAAELTEQLREFCAAYGVAPWTVVVDPTLAPSNAPRLALLPSLDVAGALGYHDKDAKGRAYGRVDCEAGQSLDDISETASHELLELRADLEADVYVWTPDGTLRAYEPCDAVQGTPYGGPRGYRLANWVTLAWYEPEMGPPYDRLGVLKEALARTPTGYVIVDEGGQITTDPPMAAIKASRAHATSRLAKRIRKHGRAVAARRERITKPVGGGTGA